MDLKSLIRPQLWIEISNSYIAENYKTAILDAMRYLSKVIREKSGLDGDGAPLAGQAFGGDEPKLRINKLQTQSEKDEQRGFQQIITGLYSAIRNPRTHEEIKDDKNSADPIIYFVNHILSVIDVASPPFTIESFLRRVFDRDFVESEDYAEELVKEIPKNKYFETLVEIYRHKNQGKDTALAYVFKSLLNFLNEAEIKEFIAIVSEELDTISDELAIISIFRIFPKKYWPQVKKTARMRIENKLIKSIESGRQGINASKTKTGGLGTWTGPIIPYFTLKENLASTVFVGLMEDDIERLKYTVNFFMSYFHLLFTEDYQYSWCCEAIKNVIKAGDRDIRITNKLKVMSDNCPDELLHVLKDSFKDWTNVEQPRFHLKDGSPFLGSVPIFAPGNLEPEDDLPF